jgi:hypothetical protein
MENATRDYQEPTLEEQETLQDITEATVVVVSGAPI